MSSNNERPHGSSADQLAHVRQDETGQWHLHPLAKHLGGTAKLAKTFAGFFGNGDWGHIAGLWHDIGKFNPDFQSYIRNKSGYDPEAHMEGAPGKVDHSTAGAIHAVEKLGPFGRILAYLIAGHHAGLPDWTHEIGVGGALSDRINQREHLERTILGGVPESILLANRPESVPCGSSLDPEHAHLWIRMLFSCLVDADFLDTESFMQPGKPLIRDSSVPDLANLKTRFDEYMVKIQSKAPDTPVNRLRHKVLQDCRSSAGLDPGFFSLTVPTGGGKTLASMAFALDHAIKWTKRRIVVVIPYTSIIEQTAAELRKAIGEDAVLEHHSNLDPDGESPRSRLATENWDAPIIVTTNVQFFESLFASRTSACRKLHNLVDSIVIFDEAQMLPPEYLKPILSALQGLVRHFGVSALLCTATQPALEGHIGSGKAAFTGLEGVRELMPDPTGLAETLNRVELRQHNASGEPTAWGALAQELSVQDQVLCIVNTRKDCRELHSLMPKGTIHLSALMCAEHRSNVIALIKCLLKLEWPVRVISTQLVEAGVDLDFPVVYRAMAGLDSMAQAAGRCNREGRLNETGRLGEVVLFAPPKPAPPGLLRKGEEAGLEMLRCLPERVAALDPEAFRRYFELFYSRVNNFDAKDMKGLLVNDTDAREFRLQFRTAASRFKLVDDTTQHSIVVRYAPKSMGIKKLLEELRWAGPSRDRMRKLQRFVVNIHEREFNTLQAQGAIQESAGIWAQAVDDLYDPVLGLCPDGAPWRPETFIR